MKLYHEIWLKHHPWRSAEWLKSHLKDGFCIHHIDGDHDNNDPKNLLLCDNSDHMQLHGLPLRQQARRANSMKKKRVPLDRDAVRDIFTGLMQGIKMSEMIKITGLSRQSLYLIKAGRLHPEWITDLWDQLVGTKLEIECGMTSLTVLRRAKGK